MATKKSPKLEVWMRVIDHKRLAKLMLIQDVSDRDLAAAAGYKAHSFISRLRRGEVKSLRVEPACAISHHLGVGVDDLFLVSVSTERADIERWQRSRAAA